MISYPVRLFPTDRGSVRAVFPDVDGATGEGRDEDEALQHAKLALEQVLTTLLQKDRKIPAPSDICGTPTVTTDMFVIQQTAADWESPLSGGRY